MTTIKQDVEAVLRAKIKTVANNVDMDLNKTKKEMEKLREEHEKTLNDLAKINKKLISVERALNNKTAIEKKLEKLGAKPEAFYNALVRTDKKVEHMAKRLQGFVTRECVLTEVSRYVRTLGSAEVIAEFHLALMRAYNWNDDFWEQRGAREFTIKQWLQKIMKLEEPAIDRSGQSSVVFDE